MDSKLALKSAIKYKTNICLNFIHSEYTDIDEIFVPKGYMNSPISFIVNLYGDKINTFQNDEPRNTEEITMFDEVKQKSYTKKIVTHYQPIEISKKLLDYCLEVIQNCDNVKAELKTLLEIK